ncbi:peptidoglycan D,D-transpeptidase FtsI family protein [Aureimonas pseudogalii]|uniref:Cell division protein FtsI (Penicillin-binding protein 3) n=1 Tax=Aureimonas pseudogalii TaxID=1744844 RepID=A0A7W6H6F3_9HYPH|nr:penicillin-binding protein 2 [Aureimonas pseudogalii]MBB3999338.1 cell division protein FtsI (penicillin-binding protein 3) [Aureimonas pseudogalii]
MIDLRKLVPARARPQAAPTLGLKPRRVEAPRNKARFAIATALFCSVYLVIGGRLVMWGAVSDPNDTYRAASGAGPITRPDLVDRNGEVLATDIKTASLFAEPKRIVDADEATESLLTVLPDLNPKVLHARLSSKAGFAWLKRELTPRQQQEILALGIPGIGFRTEKRRFYPGGPTASHIVGAVNVDNQGIAGMEKYVDDSGFRDLQTSGFASNDAMEPVKLSIDLRVQHVLRDELMAGLGRYQAIAAGGVVINVETGEVVAMASVPDYDPNTPGDALKKDNLNRMSAGTFEMGSTFKIFTTAMALDSGKVKVTDIFDTRPFRVAGFTIKEFHGKGRPLSVPEIFEYSSNVGSAREADLIGIDGHKEFLTRLGLLSRMKTELPEVATPTQPKVWKKINSMTIAFGHGVSTTPLQTVVAAAAIANGGWYIPPTFLPRTKEEADALKTRVVSQQTSDEMRGIFRLNGEQGSGKRANVPGYHVGGKTGTAEKVENGRYSKDKRFNAYIGAFPIEKPRYVVAVVIDEPKRFEKDPNATAGFNAGVMVGNVVRRAATFLNVAPDFGETGKQLLVSY